MTTRTRTPFVLITTDGRKHECDGQLVESMIRNYGEQEPWNPDGFESEWQVRIVTGPDLKDSFNSHDELLVEFRDGRTGRARVVNDVTLFGHGPLA